MRLVMVNRRPWAVGFHWGVYSPMRRLSRAGMLQRAQNLDAAYDMAALGRNECGFGGSGGNPESFEKARSLAAYVRIPRLLGLFALEDVSGDVFWWVFCRHENTMVGMGDQVCLTREDADVQLDQLRKLLGIDDQDMVVCSTVDESQQWLTPLLHVDIEALFRRRGRIISLTTPITRRKKRLLAAGALICGLIGCVWWATLWHEREEEKAKFESARQARLSKEAHRGALQNRPEHHFKQTWVEAPDVRDVAESCLSVMFGLPVMSRGWLMNDATCAGKSVTVTWEYQPQANYLELPQGGSLKSPKSAVSRVSVYGAAIRSRNGQTYPNLLTQEMATRLLYQLTQHYSARLGLTFKSPEKRVIDEVTITAPWAAGDWHLDAVSVAYLKDAKFWRSLADIPGFTLDRIVLKKHTSNWSLYGNIFAKTDAKASSSKKK
ncbi:MAG: type 4b pilus protein PilO2 [Desulfovibrio sp.]|jgi:hypothetical protein|nr:type 4b pilus protein PilO2 [Desulfovibrio sp.]